MRTEFFMHMKPPTVTQQEHQVTCKSGKPVFYDPPELAAVKAKLMGHLAKHIPEKKYTRAVRLVTKWLFPIIGKHQNGEPKITRPDLDNSMKLFLDCCTALGYWTDDAIITSLIIEKFYSEIPGIYICIEEVV